jgi:hypothetical protein
MSLTTAERNPFMLLVQPEAVLAVIQKSERLERLNRHLCRPLDRPTPTSVRQPGDAEIDADEAGSESN